MSTPPRRPGGPVAAVLAMLCLLVITAPVHARAAAAGEATTGPTTTATTATTSTTGPRTAALQAGIVRALQATRWPRLEPSIPSVIRAPLFPADNRRCGEVGPVPRTGCAWGDPGAPRTAVVVGDSLAVSYLAALRPLFAAHPGWQLRTYASLGCTFTDRRTRTGTPAANAACPAEKEEALAAVRALRPDLVLVTNRYGMRADFSTGVALSPSQWRTSQLAQARKLAPYAGRIAYLAPPPVSTDIRACYPGSGPRGCRSTVTPVWNAMAQAEASVAREVGGSFIDTRPLFCSPVGACPPFVAGVVTKPDAVHVTAAYARLVAPALGELMRQRGLL